MAAEKKRLAHWFSGKPRAKPLEGGRQRAVSRGQEAPQRAGMGILAAGPLTLAVVLANAGAPFAAPNAQSIRLQSRERSGAPAPRERAVPARIHPPRERPAPPQHRLPRQGRKLETLGHEPLTPAGILPNSGAPFAALNQCARFQSRERSGAPAPRERAVPARIHPPRAKRAAPGTDTSVPPHCHPISPTDRKSVV